MDVIKPLLNSKLLASSAAIDVLSSALLSSVGRPLDLLYSRLGGLNGRFFPTGWGNLSIVNLQEDLEHIKNWPPEGIKVTVFCKRLLCCVVAVIYSTLIAEQMYQAMLSPITTIQSMHDGCQDFDLNQQSQKHSG